MKGLIYSTAVLLAVALTVSASAKDPKPMKVGVPTGINHSSYDQLLKKYVNSRGRDMIESCGLVVKEGRKKVAD